MVFEFGSGSGKTERGPLIDQRPQAAGRILREQQRLMAVVVGVTEHLSPCRRRAAEEGSFSNLGGPTQVAESSCRAQPHIRWRPLYGTSGLQLDRAVHRLLHCSVCKFLKAKPMKFPVFSLLAGNFSSRDGFARD